MHLWQPKAEEYKRDMKKAMHPTRCIAFFDLDNDSIAVVDLVLDYLGGEAGEGLDALLKLLVEPAHLYRAVAPSLAGAVERQAALLGLICARLLYNFGVEHDLKFALVVKGNDALTYADHVRRHAHAAVLVGDERVEKILRRAEILGTRRLGLLSEKSLVPANFTNHRYQLLSRPAYHTQRGKSTY